MSKTIAALRAWGRESLSFFAELEAPDYIHSDLINRDVDELLSKATGLSKAALLADSGLVPEDVNVSDFETFIARRVAHEPLGYILGEIDFHNIALKVAPGVLIPRPETELLVERAIEVASKCEGELQIVDIGTGSGAIILAVANALRGENVKYLALDISSEALEIAKENASRLGLGDAVEFHQQDIREGFRPESEQLLVLANPPYIADSETLPKSVEDFEPLQALRAGNDGLDIVRCIISEISSSPVSRKKLLMEVGHKQRADIDSFAPGSTWIKDYQGIDRIVELDL